MGRTFFSCWLLFLPASLAQSTSTAVAVSQYERGDFVSAIEISSRLLDKGAPDFETRIELLMIRSSAYRLLGDHDLAAADLAVAVENARRLNRPPLLARALLATASAELAAGNHQASLTVAEAERTLKGETDPRLAAELEAMRGELFETQRHYVGAAQAYRTAAARATGRPLLALRSLNGLAGALEAAGDARGSAQALSEAGTLARSLPDSFERDAELIRTGVIATSLLRQSDVPEDTQGLAESVLRQAAESAERLGHVRNASHAWGNLGRLYEQFGEKLRALEVVQKAKVLGGRSNVPDPLYRWEWLSARLLASLGRSDEAIEDYGHAVDNLHEIRRASAGVASTSFRETDGQLYLQYVDLLLRKASDEPGKLQPLLRRVRETMERFKRAELAEYFRDDCVEALQAHTTEVEDISPSAMVIYPVPLPDRLELIFGSSASGLHRVAVPVRENELTDEVRTFRRLLEKRTTNEYRVPGRRLYDWLIRPLQTHSAITGVDTLVFVPDGVLRLIPFAALHDGDEFLISKFAVVVTPSLMLADARPMPIRQMSVLAGGLTESRAGLAGLPGVASELASVKSRFNTRVLRDEDFTLRALERQLRRGTYRGLHIASHAVISPDPALSYFLAHDGKLTMDRLNEVIGISRFGDRPLELLVLSGCETAVGDDRAALGLAGIALRAGAKSAVATLWHINDDSTSALVARFYELLATGAFSKAKALQEAQKQLLQHNWYQHPGYWSPFLLINNWL